MLVMILHNVLSKFTCNLISNWLIQDRKNNFKEIYLNSVSKFSKATVTKSEFINRYQCLSELKLMLEKKGVYQCRCL